MLRLIIISLASSSLAFPICQANLWSLVAQEVEQTKSPFAGKSDEELRSILASLIDDKTRNEELKKELLQNLESEDFVTRQVAAHALAARGDANDKVIEVLIEGLLHQPKLAYQLPPHAPQFAVKRLAAVGEPAVPTLLKTLQTTKSRSRVFIVETLGEIGPAAKPALETLQNGYSKVEAMEKPAWVLAIARIGGDYQFARDEYLKLLEDENVPAFFIGNGLADLGEESKPIWDAITQKFVDTNNDRYFGVATDIAVFNRDKSVPFLMSQLSSPEFGPKAAIALNGLSIPAKDVVPSQIALLRDHCRDATHGTLIAYAIGIYSYEASSYTDDILKLLEHPNANVRRSAVWCSCRVSEDRERIRKAIEPLQNDPAVSDEVDIALKMLR